MNLFKSSLLSLFLCFILLNSVFAQNADYGVLAFLNWNHSWNHYKYNDDSDLKRVVKQIKKLGVGIVRVDFPWNDIEKQQGVFNYARYDQIVDLLTKNDIEILAVVGYSPNWAARAWNMPPDNLDYFYRCALNLVNRYKGKIKYWECWNEPDSKTYFALQDGMRTYTKLLKKFYKAIKGVDSDALVLHGGVTTNGFYAIKDIIKNGGTYSFDIANIHPFVGPEREQFKTEMRNKIVALRKLLWESGKMPRIWVTEIGCPGVSKTDSSKTWWEGYAQTEEEQAEFLREAIPYLKDIEGVEKVFWAFFKDNENHFRNAVDNFGLVRKDGRSKAAYKVYQEIIRK